MTWWQLIIGVTSAGLVFMGTVVTAHFSAKTGSEANANSFMDQQRKTFESMLEPLQSQVSDLRSRVDILESEVRQERDLRERVVSYTRTLLWAWRRHFPEHVPPPPPSSIAAHFD